jgi:hypothetical protein
MNVEFEAEPALFPEKEYISGIFVAVYSSNGNDLNYTWNAGPVLKGSTNSVQRYQAGSIGPRSMLSLM